MKNIKSRQETQDIIHEILKKNGKVKLSELDTEQINRYNDLVSNLDLSKVIFNRKVNRFDEISTPLEMVNFLTDKNKINALSEEYISHYTSFDKAIKIIKSKKLYLGNPSNMNDGLEFSSPKMDSSKIYFASFSIESSENMGMWSMYGQPWHDGVRISIPKKTFMSWVDKIKRVYHVNQISYEVDGNNFVSDDAFKASISRVAYVEWNTDGNILQIRCGENAKNTRLIDVDSQILVGLIKDIAWSYEKEIRVRVDLGIESSDKNIAIDIPDEIIRSIVITTGPRFNTDISTTDFSEIMCIRKSIFAGKLNYVYCDSCKV